MQMKVYANFKDLILNDEGNLDLMASDVHEVAALLKTFLCKLPEPLIPPSLGNDIIQATS